MPADMFPPVAIVLLNYKGAEDTIECLESLQKITYPNYTVVIVDNASSDGSFQEFQKYLKAQHLKNVSFASPSDAMNSVHSVSKFTLIQSGFNGGYGYGNNIGIKFALKHGAEYVLLLNNDTIVDPGFLEPLTQMCEKDQKVGIVSGEIHFYDEPEKIWFDGGTINPRTLELTPLNFKQRKAGELPSEEKVFLSGCMWLIPNRIIKEVGLIREDFFLYMEDVDYCIRIQDRGYRLSVCSRSIIYHKVGAQSGGKIRKTVLYWRGRNFRVLLGEKLKNRRRAVFSSTIYLMHMARRLWNKRQILDIRYSIKGIRDGVAVGKVKPNLLLIGVHKAGTTSLFDALVRHPDVERGKRKEIHFFSPLRYGGSTRPLRYYVNQFSQQSGARFRLDASPSYFYGGMEIAQAIRLTLGKPKLILVLRDPVERFISFYRFLKGTLRLRRDVRFADFLEQSTELAQAADRDDIYYRGVREGRYGDYLADWMKIFGSDLKVVFFEEIVQQSCLLLSDLAQWLEIDPAPFSSASQAIGHSNKTRLPRLNQLHRLALTGNRQMDRFIRRFPRVKEMMVSLYYAINEREDSEIIDAKLKNRLREYYQDSNKRARKLLTEAGYSRLPDWLGDS